MQQPEAVVLQSGQGGNGEGLHVFGRHCSSARSDDTDRWSSTEKGLRSHTMCQRGRASAGVGPDLTSPLKGPFKGFKLPLKGYPSSPP